MEQEAYTTQPVEHDLDVIRERRRLRERYQYMDDDLEMDGEAPQSRGDYLVHMVLLQLLLCALLLGLVFAVRTYSPDVFQQLRTGYQSLMSVDMNVREVFSALRGEVVDPLQNWASGQVESSTEATDTTTQSTTLQEDASGGVDVQVRSARENTSFAPVYTTMQAHLPVEGRLSSPFGYRIHPVTKKESFHTGVDIAAESGTPIAAAFGGVVTDAGFEESWGYYVKIQHQDGLETFYAHCQEIYAETGTVLRAGEHIALVGSTGVSTGPHLHFEVRVNGVRCNPVWLLPL